MRALRFDATQNQSLDDFSYNPGRSETQLLNRTRVHVESHPADWVRIYFEPQFYGRWGGFNNEDRFSVYQGYVEFPRLGQLPVSLRVGRQDFVYGSAFFMGNDDFYRGLNWDGARIRVKPLCNLSVDLLAARLVNYTSNKAEQPGLYGFYSTYRGIRNVDWDFYFFYNRHGFNNLYEHLSDSPLWFTAGTRCCHENDLSALTSSLSLCISSARCAILTGAVMTRYGRMAATSTLTYEFWPFPMSRALW